MLSTGVLEAVAISALFQTNNTCQNERFLLETARNEKLASNDIGHTIRFSILNVIKVDDNDSHTNCGVTFSQYQREDDTTSLVSHELWCNEISLMSEIKILN